MIYPASFLNRFRRPVPDTLPDNIRAKTGPSRTWIDPEATYARLLITDAPALLASATDNHDTEPYQVTHRISGDHIYVANINGTARWGIRVGFRTNPVLPIHPGMTIHRNFQEFTVVALDAPGNGNRGEGSELQPTELELYVSRGPLVVTPPVRSYGFGMGMLGGMDFTANTAPGFFPNAWFPDSTIGSRFRLGRRGATLMLRNADVANTLILMQRTVDDFGTTDANLWRLYPGEAMSLVLDGELVNVEENRGLMLVTAAGTCKFDFLFSSREQDGKTSLTRVDMT